MNRFVIEHLPRAVATYQVTPVAYEAAQSWLLQSDVISLVRTTELIGAIANGLGVSLTQSDTLMTLAPGDEALLIYLSFSVMLAWAEGGIPPVEEDWRCLLIRVAGPAEDTPLVERAASQDLAVN